MEVAAEMCAVVQKESTYNLHSLQLLALHTLRFFFEVFFRLKNSPVLDTFIYFFCTRFKICRVWVICVIYFEGMCDGLGWPFQLQFVDTPTSPPPVRQKEQGGEERRTLESCLARFQPSSRLGPALAWATKAPNGAEPLHPSQRWYPGRSWMGVQFGHTHTHLTNELIMFPFIFPHCPDCPFWRASIPNRCYAVLGYVPYATCHMPPWMSCNHSSVDSIPPPPETVLCLLCPVTI